VTHAYLKAHDLSHHFGGDTLFSGVDLVLGPGDRIGLVGPNGVGKSTLLAVLAGRITPVGGRVVRSPGTRVGWFEQQVAEPGARVGDHLAAGLGEIPALARRMRELEYALEQHADSQDALDEYGRLQERWAALDGWTAQSRLDRVRDRLGLAALADDTALAQVSGGEQARLALARLLLSDPDVLVLDEPTNHLDADGAAWLGEYLSGFRGGVLVVSHDRAFLDRAVNRVVELDGIHEEPQHYVGGYTEYRAEKLRRWQALLLDFEAQEKYRRRLATDIDRAREQADHTQQATTDSKMRRYAKKVAKKAKAREHRLERQIASLRWIEQPQTRPELVLAFPGDAAADGTVLTARGLSAKRGGRVLFDGADLELNAGDRVLIAGPNGAGKTTLLRILAGQAEADSGTVEWNPEQLNTAQWNSGQGSSGTDLVGLLPQTHDALRTGETGRSTVFEFFRRRVPVYAEQAESMLDGYLFGADQWDARLRDLSAGELRRLLLAVLVNSPARVLLLDEPTNYLDFDALDVVEEALQAYRGTLVAVTHDRYFADRVGFAKQWSVGSGELVTGS
jgi:ATPase subunit of ABC transporter with duplicated ATPase domains